MKQILRYSLVALLAMIVGNVMATDITFVPSDFTALATQNYSLTKDGVTVAVTASTVTAKEIRVFKGQTITISSAVGNITKAVFTCTAEGTDKYGPGCFGDATAGSYSYDGRTGTWMGDAAEFMLTAKTNQVRITSIVVTVDGVTDNRIATTITQDNIVLDLADVGTLTRLTPVVKDASGNVIEYTNSLAAEGIPDVFFDLVADDNGMFGYFDSHGNIILNSVTGTATVKAVYNYFNTSDVYKPSECTFTITVVSPLENIAALTANTEAGTYKVNLTDAVVTYVNGNYAYIQDASGAVAMYKKNHGLTAGDVLNGAATVAYQVRNGNPQITDLSSVTPVAGSAPDPEVVAQDAWSYEFNEVLSQYFQVTGATLTKNGTKYYVELDGEDVQLYKVGEALGDLDLNKTYTITGFPTLYVKNETTTKELQIFIDPEEEIVITDAKYATFVSSRDVDFSTTGITAYTAQVSGSSVALTEITKVPANTPVVIYKADADGTVLYAPTATSTDPVGINQLEVSDGTVTGGDGIYVLANKDAGVGFYKLKNTVTIPAGKCYLNTAVDAPDFLGFEGGTTGIDEVRGQKEEVRGEFYNLAGQRVAQPTKGLYIVNGKKYMVK